MNPELTRLRNQYVCDHLVVLRQLAGSNDVERIIEESPLWLKQTVYVRPEDGVTWLSQTVPEDSFLRAWFLSERILQTVRALSSFTSPLMRTECWTNLYQLGECITPHKDAAGSVQLLLNLEVPPTECGGTFIARIRGSSSEIFLEAGDAVLFEATSVEHYTVPLRGMPSCPRPHRMTAVMRFYFE